MHIDDMTDDARTVRKVVSFSPDEWEPVDDFRFANRLKSEAEAIRFLIRAGLEATAKSGKP